MSAIKEAFNLMGDDIIEISVEEESLKNQIGECDVKSLRKSKAKLLKKLMTRKKLF